MSLIDDYEAYATMCVLHKMSLAESMNFMYTACPELKKDLYFQSVFPSMYVIKKIEINN